MYIQKEELKLSERIYKTSFEGLYYIAHSTFPDERGFFSETAIIPEIESITKRPFIPKQINHTRSKQNIIRGFHAEAWDKLVTITSGIGFCVLLDIRSDSATFGQTETFILGIGKDALDGSLFISSGIANSICVIDGPVDYIYIVNKLYKDRDPKGDAAISLFDPDINVSWPIAKEKMIISERDKNALTLRQKFPVKFVNK
jgi:dTDP-4-dehydrorhamnose 3,5-epimerase